MKNPFKSYYKVVLIRDFPIKYPIFEVGKVFTLNKLHITNHGTIQINSLEDEASLWVPISYVSIHKLINWPRILLILFFVILFSALILYYYI